MRTLDSQLWVDDAPACIRRRHARGAGRMPDGDDVLAHRSNNIIVRLGGTHVAVRIYNETVPGLRGDIASGRSHSGEHCEGVEVGRQEGRIDYREVEGIRRV